MPKERITYTVIMEPKEGDSLRATAAGQKDFNLPRIKEFFNNSFHHWQVVEEKCEFPVRVEVKVEG